MSMHETGWLWISRWQARIGFNSSMTRGQTVLQKKKKSEVYWTTIKKEFVKKIKTITTALNIMI